MAARSPSSANPLVLQRILSYERLAERDMVLCVEDEPGALGLLLQSVVRVRGSLPLEVLHSRLSRIWYCTASATRSSAISSAPVKSATVRATLRHRCAARALSENDSTAFCRSATEWRSSRQKASSSTRPMSALARTRGRSWNRRCWIARATCTRLRMDAESHAVDSAGEEVSRISAATAIILDSACVAFLRVPRNNSRTVTAGTSTCMSIRSSNGPLSRALYNWTCRGVHLHGLRGCPRNPHGHPCVAILQSDAEKPDTHW